MTFTEIGPKLNVGPFSKTKVPSFFKVCVNVTSHEHYQCASFSVTFDLYSGHKVSGRLNACITVQCKSYEHLLFLFLHCNCLQINRFAFFPCPVAVLVS